MAKKKDDEEEQLDDADAGEAKTGGKKFLIIIIAAVVLLLGGGAAAYFLLFAKKDEKKETPEATEESSAEEHGAEKGAEGKDAVSGPVYYEMPEFLVNLTSPTKQTSFLKMKITLELKSKADVKSVEKFLPRITDSFNTYLRELRPTDLAGSAGMYRLREELLLRINQAITPAEVQNILFKEVIVQ